MTAMLLTVGISIASMVLAYIGPGVGAGAIAAALGLIGSFFLGLFAVLFYPIKRLIKKFKNTPPSGAETQVGDDGNA